MPSNGCVAKPKLSRGIATTKTITTQSSIKSIKSTTSTTTTTKFSKVSTSKTYKRLKRDCIRRKQLYVDLEFPPTNSSLFLDVNRSTDIVWKRPGEIVKNPKLFVEGASPNDVTQGILGNCWFVSACSTLTHNDDLLYKVIPNAEAQEWVNDDDGLTPSSAYAGIFQFRFWRFGEWIEVIIDDLLPTKDGKLLFARSKTKNEFWSALLEKAFAKLYGCYENLVGGQLADALQDVSGGVAETINVAKFLAGDVRDSKGKLFQTLRSAFEQNALIVAAIAAKCKEDVEQSLDCGLVKGHAYAVTAVRYINLDGKIDKKRNSLLQFFPIIERQQMIRLQNPWGEKEWNGPWSDGSIEWEQVAESQKKALGITVDEDGEFWMPSEQFVQYFTDISVCQLFNTHTIRVRTLTGSRRIPSNSYKEYIFYDSWNTNGVKSGAPRDRAGGCQNFAATFCSNPQYYFDVQPGDGNDVMIALTQKDSLVEQYVKQRKPFTTIGLHVMQVERNRRFRIHQAINPIATSDYASARSVYLHLRDLLPGRYIVMPTTYAPREQADFLLRLYSTQLINVRPLLFDAPQTGFIQCTTNFTITRLKINNATFSFPKDLNVYCKVHSEKDHVRTKTVAVNGVNVKFDEMFLFHRNSLRQKYIIEIFEERKYRFDQRLARCILNILTDNDTINCTLDMQQSKSNYATASIRSNHSTVIAVGQNFINTDVSMGASNITIRISKQSKSIVGQLVLEISSYDDPMYL